MAKPLRDPTVLDREAAAAREQARGLHKAAVDAVGRENDQWGDRRDAAQREALAARAAAEAAHKQANELYAERNRHAESAGEQNAYAARINATNPSEAEEWFEDANGVVRVAESLSARAETAREIANELSAEADALEVHLQHIEQEGFAPDYRGRELEAAGDLLDDKARLLEEAAAQQREAETFAGDPGAASGSLNYARYALEKADGMDPDYSRIDTHVLEDAGVPRSETPGSELMDPYASDPYAAADPYDGAVDSYAGNTYTNDADLEVPYDSAGFDTSAELG